jgi:hypothetical protein
MQVSSVDSVCWTSAGGHETEFWSGENFLLFHAATMLFYIAQIITVPKLCIFLRSIVTHHCMAYIMLC